MASVTTCVTLNCTIPDALVVKNVSSTACGVPVRDEGTHYNIVSVTLGVISGAVIIMRLGFKLFIAKTGLGFDDWFILATILVGVPSSVITSEGLVPNGLGRDIWTLKPQQITNVSKAVANIGVSGWIMACFRAVPRFISTYDIRTFRSARSSVEAMFCDRATDSVMNRFYTTFTSWRGSTSFNWPCSRHHYCSFT